MAPTTLDDFERFEKAWKLTPPGEEPPRWQDYIPSDLSDTPHVLLTLFLETDIEKRIKSGRPALLNERYWEQPGLGYWTPVQRLELVQFEMAQRRRAGEHCSTTDYALAFPELAEALKDLHLNTPGVSSRETPSGELPENIPSDSQEPPRMSGYILQERLGSGGMGIVWRAKDLSLERDVAVKMLKSEFLKERYRRDGAVAGRFLDEARITGQLQHPGIPAVYHVGKLENDRPFFAMKLVKGRSLDKMLKEKASINTMAVFEQIAQAVGYAHAHGVLHRDLKPANVMVGAFGEVQVMDWGLAKVLGTPETYQKRTAGLTIISSARDSDHATSYGSLLGTPAFTPPEQAVGEIEQMSERSDVFGLGAILCNLLTGQPPYVGHDEKETKLLAKRGKLDAAYERLADCGGDPDLIGLCMKCLQADAADRMANGTEVANAVARLRADAEERAKQAEIDRARAEVRVGEQRWRRRVQLRYSAALVATLLAGTGIAAWMAWYGWNEADRADQAVIKEKEQSSAAKKQEMRAKASEEKSLNIAMELFDVALHAEALRDLAEREKALAEKRTSELDSEKSRAETLLYAMQLEAAQRHWFNGRTDLARKALNECRWDYRGCEFDLRFSQFTGSHVQLPWHRAPVTAATFTTDSARIIAGNLESGFRVFDTRTGAILKDLSIPLTDVTMIAISPDGKQLAVVDEQSLRIFDSESLQLRNSLAQQGITSLAFSPDGSRLFFGCSTAARVNDGIAQKEILMKVWDHASGSILAAIRGHRHEITCLAVSPDGQRVVTGSVDLSIRIADLVTGHSRELTLWPTHSSALAFSPDGRFIVTGGHDTMISIWNATNGSLERELPTKVTSVTALAVSPDGCRLAVAGNDSIIRLWDLAGSRIIAELKGHIRQESGSLTKSGSSLRDFKDGKDLSEVNGLSDRMGSRVVDRIHFVRFSSDGTRLLSGGSDQSLRLWSVCGDSNTLKIPVQASPFLTMAASPDGRWIASGDDKGFLKIWNTRTRIPIREFRSHAGPVECAAFSPDSVWIATAGLDHSLRISSVTGPDTILIPNAHERSFLALAFRGDGRMLASAGEDHLIRLWNPLNGKLLTELQGHTKYVTTLAFSPDNTLLASGSLDGTIRIWELRGNSPPLLLNGHATGVRAVAFSPDGKWIASGGNDRMLRIWNNTGGLVRELEGHSQLVTCVAFSPDSRRILSGSKDSTLRIWDVRTGLFLMELPGEGELLLSIACVADGSRIVSTRSDNSARFWDVRGGIHETELPGKFRDITDVAFSDDGRTIFARSSPGQDSKRDPPVQAWDSGTGQLVTITVDAAHLQWSRRTLTSPDRTLSIEPNGGQVAVRFIAKSGRYQQFVRDRLEDWLQLSPLWHQQLAREAEQQSQWYTAAFHYRRLVAIFPQSFQYRMLLSHAEGKARVTAEKK